MDKPNYTLNDIAAHVGGRVVGNGDRVVRMIAPIQSAEAEDITFCVDKQLASYLGSSSAAIIVDESLLSSCRSDAIVCASPYLAYAKVAQLFNMNKLKESQKPGIAASAVIDQSANVHPSCVIGHHVVIQANVTVGEGTVIHSGSVIGESVVIGDRCHLFANVTVYSRCVLNNDVCIHSGSVIGSEGFGHAKNEMGEWIAIPQLGKVILKNKVEIGANCTIDRGSLTDTIIGEGVIIDNLVQIAHNVVIGDHTAIAACVGIAGTVTIGKRCLIAGQVGISGHLTITDDVTLLAKSQVTKSIKKAGIYSSVVGCQERSEWNKNSARLRNLDKIIRKLQSEEVS